MSACPDCQRAFDRNGDCPVCFDGGPYAGDVAEWYDVKPGGSMTPAEGRVKSKETTSEGVEYFKVRRGKTGSGKEISITRQRLTRVFR